MNSSESIIVVAPGSTAELIQELMSARILPSHTNFVVLLPPGKTQQYDHFVAKKGSLGRNQFLPSPAQRFFSIRHLNWLWANLRSSKSNMLLIVESPFQDPITAIICLTVLTLSGKTITLLYATPEAVIDFHGQGFSERWLSQKLNLKILAGEFSRIFWFLNPWNILYFLMFGGLIMRQWLSEYLTSIPQKVGHQKRSDRYSKAKNL
jgi:hypothetical protein